jgi:hypothetical protein
MVIQYVVLALTYLLLLVLAYQVIIFMNDEKSEEIISVAFNHAYTILFFGLLVVYSMVQHPYTDFDHQTTSFLILGSKLISVLTLGGSLYLLTRKRCKSTR